MKNSEPLVENPVTDSNIVQEARDRLSAAVRGWIGPWSVEPHGPEGQFALYSGRTEKRHGLRLCNINDGDSNFQETLALIVNAPRLIAELLAEIDRLNKESAELKAAEATYQHFESKTPEVIKASCILDGPNLEFEEVDYEIRALARDWLNK